MLIPDITPPTVNVFTAWHLPVVWLAVQRAAFGQTKQMMGWSIFSPLHYELGLKKRSNVFISFFFGGHHLSDLTVWYFSFVVFAIMQKVYMYTAWLSLKIVFPCWLLLDSSSCLTFEHLCLKAWNSFRKFQASQTQENRRSIKYRTGYICRIW